MRPSGASTFSPLPIVPIQSAPPRSSRSDVTGASPTAFCRPTSVSERRGDPGSGVEAHEPGRERGDPQLVVRSVRERRDGAILEPRRPVPAELPAARIPAADAARARADPDEPVPVLIQRHHERIAQRRAVVRVVTITTERARRAIEQREPVRRADPEAPRPILEQRSHVVAAERCGVACVVAKRLEDAAVAIQADEAIARTCRSTTCPSGPRARAKSSARRGRRCASWCAYLRAND